jgi:hypothetical protein
MCVPASYGMGNDFASELLAGADMSPRTSNDQIMRALQAQTAFIEGDPSSKEDLELYYYRFVCALFYVSHFTTHTKLSLS